MWSRLTTLREVSAMVKIGWVEWVKLRATTVEEDENRLFGF
jgi:hypothetical protein